MKIELGNLSYSYGTIQVLNNISCQLQPGVNIIIGPNAAGKSTLLKCLCGVLKPDGFIRLKGKELNSFTRPQLTEMISYLPQNISGKGALTVFEAVLLGLLHSLSLRVSQEQLETVHQILCDLNIEKLSSRPISELSGGQYQLVAIAQALIHNPEVLIMDEPTNNLDIHFQFEVMEMVFELTRKRQITTILALHDLNLASQFADTIIIIKDGILVNHGKPDAILNEEIIKEIYSIDTQVTRDETNNMLIIPMRSRNNIGR